MSEISLEDFLKVDVRAGKVLAAEEVAGSEKLLRLRVDFGELGEKQVLSGIKAWYTPEEIEGKVYPFVVNLPPVKMMGLVSEAMIVAATSQKASHYAKASRDKSRGEPAGGEEAVLFEAVRGVVPGSRLH